MGFGMRFQPRGLAKHALVVASSAMGFGEATSHGVTLAYQAVGGCVSNHGWLQGKTQPCAVSNPGLEVTLPAISVDKGTKSPPWGVIYPAVGVAFPAMGFGKASLG